MTANEMYQLQEKRRYNEIDCLVGFYFNHIPEANIDSGTLHSLGSVPEIEIREIAVRYYDHRRFWFLATVWFNNEPVMIIQNAGREGDDHYGRFITNIEAYKNMVSHIVKLSARCDEQSTDDIIDPNLDTKALTEFYSDTLENITGAAL